MVMLNSLNSVTKIFDIAVADPGFSPGGAPTPKSAIITPPTMKLGQGNIFRSVCQEFCPEGGHVWLLGGMHEARGCMVARGSCVVAGGMCGWQGGMHGCQGVGMVAGGMCGCWGACMVAGGHAWLPERCVWLPGGMHGGQGVCMVARVAWLLGGTWLWGACMVAGGCVWFWGVHGCGGVCVVAGGRVCVVAGGCMVAGGHA